MYSLDNIYKSFDNNQVLKGVSLEIPKNKTTVLIGPSGSGKTTLLRCINLLEIPDSGTVNVNGSSMTFHEGQLFIMYWGICNPLGINKWVACISALSLNVGAYSAETIRAAILSINKGQWEAGYSLGMSYQQTFRRIIIPQAATVSIPPLFNTFIGLVKDTSLASTIMIGEMFRKAQEAAASSLEYLWIYIEVALIYLLFCTLLTGLQKWIEKKLRVGK